MSGDSIHLPAAAAGKRLFPARLALARRLANRPSFARLRTGTTAQPLPRQGVNNQIRKGTKIVAGAVVAACNRLTAL